jgi:hypothetical protein
MRPPHLKEIFFRFHHKIIPMEYPFPVCDQLKYLQPIAYDVAFGIKTWFGKARY